MVTKIIQFVVKYRYAFIAMGVLILVLILRRNWHTIFKQKRYDQDYPVENSPLKLTKEQEQALQILAHNIYQDLQSTIYTPIINIQEILKIDNKGLIFLKKSYIMAYNKSLYDDIAEEKFLLSSDKEIVKKVLNKLNSVS